MNKPLELEVLRPCPWAAVGERHAVRMAKPWLRCSCGAVFLLHIPVGAPVCICTETCDCQNPEPASGARLVSMECPIHNENPYPNPECPVHAKEA